MHWAPEQTDPDRILSEYYSGFGASSEPVKKYINYWTDWTNQTFTSNATRNRILNLTHAISKQAGTSHGWYKNIAFVYLSSVFDAADELLDAARAACGAAENTCLQRVEFLSTGSMHGRLVAEAMNATSAAGENIPGRGVSRQATRRWVNRAPECLGYLLTYCL